MPPSSPLVSIALPIRNGEHKLTEVVKSVLAQDHDNLEFVISDNASTDATEEICREFARADPRIAYHRHPHNVGLFNNFNATIRLAKGEFFRWIGHDDTLEPTYVSRCLAAFREDEQRVLVSTQIAYLHPSESSEPSERSNPGEGSEAGGSAQSAAYHGTALASHDPVVRLREMLRLLNESYLLMDPLYSLIRRDVLLGLPRRNVYNEDQVLACRLALAGPWGHINEVLASRPWEHEARGEVARKNDVPVWQVRVATALQCREILRYVGSSDLDPGQQRQARAAVRRFYLRRHQNVAARRARRLAAVGGRLVAPRRSTDVSA